LDSCFFVSEAFVSKVKQVRAWGLSDIGKKRRKNEDSFLLGHEHGLFVVADGMGGHLGGAVASELTVKTIAEVVKTHKQQLGNKSLNGDLTQHPAAHLLADAMRAACEKVFTEGLQHAELTGMGTTATCLLVIGTQAFVGHVGDSRAYLTRGGQIMQLTEDHSLVHQQVKDGLLTEEQAKASPFRNVITRSIGFERDVDVDVIGIETLPGDVFVLCSDGLTLHVGDSEILASAGEKQLSTAPAKLVALANSRGGEDNITALIIQMAPNRACPHSAARANKTLAISKENLP
jgi:protein phosphatase